MAEQNTTQIQQDTIISTTDKNPVIGTHNKSSNTGGYYYLFGYDKSKTDSLENKINCYYNNYDFSKYLQTIQYIQPAYNDRMATNILSGIIGAWTNGAKFQRDLNQVESVKDKRSLEAYNAFMHGTTGFNDIRYRKTTSKTNEDGSLGYEMTADEFRNRYRTLDDINNIMDNIGTPFQAYYDQNNKKYNFYRRESHPDYFANGMPKISYNFWNRNKPLIDEDVRAYNDEFPVTKLQFVLPYKRYELGIFNADWAAKDDDRYIKEFTNNLKDNYNLTLNDLEQAGVVIEDNNDDLGGKRITFAKNLDYNLAAKILTCIPNDMLDSDNNKLRLIGLTENGESYTDKSSYIRGSSRRDILNLKRLVSSLKYTNDKVNHKLGNQAEVHNITEAEIPMYDSTRDMIDALKKGTLKYSTFATMRKDLDEVLIKQLKNEDDIKNLLISGLNNKYGEKKSSYVYTPVTKESEWEDIITAKNKSKKDKDNKISFEVAGYGYDNGTTPGFLFQVYDSDNRLMHKIFWKGNNEFAKAYENSNEVIVQKISQNVDNGGEFDRLDGTKIKYDNGGYHIIYKDGSISKDAISKDEAKAIYIADVIKARLRYQVFANNNFTNRFGIINTTPLKKDIVKTIAASFLQAYDRNMFNDVINDEQEFINSQKYKNYTPKYKLTKTDGETIISLDDILHYPEEEKIDGGTRIIGISDDDLTSSQYYLRKYCNEIYDYLMDVLSNIDNINQQQK